MPEIKNIKIISQMLAQITEIDEFKGICTGFASLKPEQLKVLRKIFSIESICSSNRIEGNKLTDAEAELMNAVFDNYSVITLTENYIKLSRNQRAVLKLFDDDKTELRSSEIAAQLGFNIETAKKSVKSLTDAGYLAKHSTTKGACYERAA